MWIWFKSKAAVLHLMYNKNILSRLLLLLALLPGSTAFSQSVLYVAPKGNDVGTGTKSQPFGSIKRALTKARSIAGPVTIQLFGGTYYLKEPLVFTAADSRKAGQPLTLTGVENQKVTISGATPLKGLTWKPFQNGIWQARVTGNLKFDQLLVNGELVRMARYPNYDPNARFLGGTAADAVSIGKAAGWKSPQGGYIHALHRAEWGDFHYLITGKDSAGALTMEGGWQNNRRGPMHAEHRFVENIFEELDQENEWFYDRKTQVLYFKPPKGLNLKTAIFESPQIAHLIEFRGSQDAPVANIHVSDLILTGTTRTFMENKEPLLRSDWTIYRGGGVLFDGAIGCSLKNCTLTNLGGNAVFFNNFNRGCAVSGCLIYQIGASAVCFVGDPKAVRSPSFEYNEFVPLAALDRVAGPKTDNYPADCEVYDNLMFNLGNVEKQTAGVELSMCQSIKVSHNTIYDVPRAGINVSEGTWGGHLIEYNDVFDTVKESGDHGSFNSWGRDRYWHPNKKVLDSIVASEPDLAFLDVVKPITLRNNRFRCDHGWDIDLDDGSSNYLLYGNLCLNGGIKLREGVRRTVENNIMINNSFHPHVWFADSKDIFRHNIVTTGYKPIGIDNWGSDINFNVFTDSLSLHEAQGRGTDQNSVYCDPLFVNPSAGDFRVKEGSKALAVGFKNFDMDSFGVVSIHLKKLAKKVPIPEIMRFDQADGQELTAFMGAKVKNLTTLGERSATGMDAIRGVLVVSVVEATGNKGFFLPNDVVLEFNGKKVNTVRDLLDARISVIGTKADVTVFRNQREMKAVMELGGKR
jgi:hypothetical protein